MASDASVSLPPGAVLDSASSDDSQISLPPGAQLDSVQPSIEDYYQQARRENWSAGPYTPPSSLAPKPWYNTPQTPRTPPGAPLSYVPAKPTPVSKQPATAGNLPMALPSSLDDQYNAMMESVFAHPSPAQTVHQVESLRPQPGPKPITQDPSLYPHAQLPVRGTASERPGSALEGAATGTDLEATEVMTPQELEAYKAGTAMPGPLTGAVQIASGYARAMDPKESLAGAGSEMLGGAMQVFLPSFTKALFVSPVRTAVGLGVGAGAGAAAQHTAEYFGATPEQAKFVGDVGFFIPSWLGAAAGLKSARLETSSGNFRAVSVLGGRVRGGTAVTPDALVARAQVGDKVFGIEIPRGGATPETPPPSDAAKALADFEQHSGNPDFKPAPSPLSNGPDHLTPEVLEGVSKIIRSSDPAQRSQLMLEAHANLVRWMMARGTFTGPDQRIHNVETPAQAKNLASKFINDEVERIDQQAAEAQQAAQEQPQLQAAAQPKPEETIQQKAARIRARAAQRTPQPEAQGQPQPIVQTPQGQPTVSAPVPPMGKGMTQDSPAVQKVEQEANLTPGQEPTVMVKKEEPSQETKLAQPPKSVESEKVAEVGKREEESGRPILQPTNSPLENDRLAGDAAPELAEKLSQLASRVEGAKFDRLRPQKNLDRVDEKIDHDKPANTIGDYLAGQIAVDSPEAAQRMRDAIAQQFEIVDEENKLLEGRKDKAGYPSWNLQLKMSNGSTAEVQLVPAEVQAVTDESHRYYTAGREAKTDAEREQLWAKAEEINQGALQRFTERSGIAGGQPSELEISLPPGAVLDSEAEAASGREGERGFASLDVPLALAEGAGKAVQDFLAKRAERQYFTAQARNLESGLATLDRKSEAAHLDIRDLLKQVNVTFTPQEEEDVYHSFEARSEAGLTENEKLLKRQFVQPLKAGNKSFREELKGYGWGDLFPDDEDSWIHRVVEGKPSRLQASVERAQGGKGSILSKSASSTKGRAMFALEDADGTRVVVHKGPDRLTAFAGGQAMDMGPYNRLQVGDTFRDKDGQPWTLQNATTKEIEGATDLKYFKSAMAVTAIDHLELQRAVNAARFLEAFKNAPEFSTVAAKSGADAPRGWKPSAIPQFQGYSFEPRTREVLDDLYDRMTNYEPAGMLEKIGDTLQTAVLLNPLMHIANMADLWATERGIVKMAQIWKGDQDVRAGLRALEAVTTRNDDFKDALRAGAPLMSHKNLVRDVNRLFEENLKGAVDADPKVADKMRELLGIGKEENPANYVRQASHAVAFMGNDLFLLQSVYRKMANNDMTFERALKQTLRTFPDYRVPTRVLDSKVLADVLKNRMMTWFSGWHYGRWKAYRNMIADSIKPDASPEDRRMALSRLAMLAMLLAVAYPLYDKLLKYASNDPNARSRRFGLSSAVDDVARWAQGKKDLTTIIESQITPSALLREGVQQVINRDLFTGGRVRNPNAPAATQLKQMGEHAEKNIAGPVAQWNRYKDEPEPIRHFALSQLGVEFPKSETRTPAEQTMYNILREKMVFSPELEQELREKHRRMAEGKMTRQEVITQHKNEFLRLMRDFNSSEVQQVYDKLDTQERETVGGAIARMMLMKKFNEMRARAAP